MSDEFASRALARADRLQAVVPGITMTQLAAVLMLTAVYLLTSFYALHHTDLWAHLAYGREMSATGKLLDAEPFGVADNRERFVNVPWLSQLIGYKIYAVTGPTGLRLLHATLATVAVLFMLLAARSQRVSWPWAICAAAVAYGLSSTVVGVIRPQLIGMAALPLVLLAVGRIAKYRDPLFWLPITFLLWANLHGSFVLGVFVMCLVLFDDLLASRRKTKSWPAALLKQANRRFALLVALCLIATLINPLGPGLWPVVLGFSQHTNLADIVEWRHLSINSVGGAMFFLTLLLTAILLRFSPRRIRLSDVLIILAFATVTLLSTRMIAWWALIWPWVVVPHAMAVARARFGRLVDQSSDRQPIRTLIAVAAVFLALVWAPASHAVLADRPLTEATAVNGETPILLADELNSRGLHGKVFAPLAWADYLLWSSNGRIQPLVYSHVHLIDAETWDAYRQINAGQAGWLRIADQAGVKYLILPRYDAKSPLIVSHPRTVVRYQDQQSIVVELLLPTEEELPNNGAGATESPQMQSSTVDTTTGL